MKEVEKFEPQVGTLKLSEAIREGAKKRGQCSTFLFYQGSSCAVGAAYEGMTGNHLPDRSGFSQLPKDWFNTYCSGSMRAIGDEIWKRNDAGHTREAIADWLEAKGY